MSFFWFFFHSFYFIRSLKISHWENPRNSARVLCKGPSLEGTINPPRINSSQYESVETIFVSIFNTVSSSLLRSTALKKKLHVHCSSHLFITVTVIVTAKTLLAHTVSLLQSHKTCQPWKKREAKGRGSKKKSGRRLKTAFIARLQAP